MKRYIQILILIICTLSFGSPSKAQEAAPKTNYPNLVYYNLMVTHAELSKLKDMMKKFIDVPHPYDEVFSKQMALRHGHLALTMYAPIDAIQMAVKNKDIMLIKEDSVALEGIYEALVGTQPILEGYIADVNSKKINFRDISKFREARGKIREAKHLIEEILDRSADYKAPQDEKERVEEKD